MRLYLYLLAGINSALIGWSIGQIFLADLGLFTQFPEIVLFPCVAISLAVGMVANEIFISNPTRPKLSLRIARIPLLIAIALGIGFGLVAGIISQILFAPQIPVPTPIVRTFGWLLVGVAVGVAEGLSWRWHSIEAGDRDRFVRRLQASVIGSSIASAIAAILFEFLRAILEEMPPAFKRAEDPLGFALLGMLLGLTFSITNSPSYLAALRAGKGFEYQRVYSKLPSGAIVTDYPQIQAPLRFLSTHELRIEEGLSIQLPAQGEITIGSHPDAQIRIPELPTHAAVLKISAREALLEPDVHAYSTVEINGNRLGTARAIALKHNYLVAFYPEDPHHPDAKEIYRFVYYNRFLDPQA